MPHDVPPLDPAYTALVLIEFQREWLDPDGRLNGLMQDRAQFSAAVTAGRDLVHAVRAAGLPIFHVGLRFTPGYPELGRSDLGLRAAIPRAGTFVGRGAEFAPPFAPVGGELVVAGRLGASGFAGSNLDALLRHRGVDTVLIAGFALHVCVESTLRQAHDLGYRAVVVADACAAFTAAQRRHVLEDVVHHFGAVADVARVCAALAAPLAAGQAVRAA